MALASLSGAIGSRPARSTLGVELADTGGGAGPPTRGVVAQPADRAKATARPPKARAARRTGLLDIHNYWRADQPPAGARDQVFLAAGRGALSNALHKPLISVAFPGDGYGSDMGRMVDVEQLVPAKVIADRLGFKGVQAVHYFLRSDPTFPQPIFVQPDMARPFRLWCWPDVEAWWAVRRQRAPRADPADLALAKSRLHGTGAARRSEPGYGKAKRKN